MTKVTDSKLFLDSSIWLGYFLGNIPQTKAIVDNQNNILFTSILSVHEIFKKLKKLKKTKEARKAIKFVEANSIIVDLNIEISISAVNHCEKYNLHTIDSLIYSSSMQTKTVFITADKDFKKTPKTKIIVI